MASLAPLGVDVVTTQVFLRGANLAACDAWGPGDTDWNPNTGFALQALTGKFIGACRLSRGAGVASGTKVSVGSSTNRHRFGPELMHWVTPPIDRDVTIASTITFNLWMSESNMLANVQAGCYVARIAPDGTLSAAIGDSTDGVELGTAIAAMNWTQTATSLACHRGDRLLIVPYFTNIGTQGSGYTITFVYNGATTAADGDSYVTFTEDFGFMDSLASDISIATATSSGATVGNVTAEQAVGCSFRLPAPRDLASIQLEVKKIGSPTDNMEVALQADSSGSPSGTDLTSASVAGTSLTTSFVSTTFNLTDYSLAADTTYWLVVRRSGAVNDLNYYIANYGTPPQGIWRISEWYSFTPWAPMGVGIRPAGLILNFVALSNNTIYPTTTASAVDPNGATYDAKEAWTSRGSG